MDMTERLSFSLHFGSCANLFTGVLLLQLDEEAEIQSEPEVG